MSNIPSNRGLFIAFAGVDGAGKSTQARLLHKRISDSGISCYLAEMRDPFDIHMMQTIAAVSGRTSFREFFGNDAVDLIITFNSLRDYLLTTAPFYKRGGVVVASRAVQARVAVAMAYENSNVDLLRAVVAEADSPDLTLFLEVSAAVAMARISARGCVSEDEVVLNRFAQALRVEADLNDWLSIDGTGAVHEIQEKVWSLVERELLQRSGLLRRKA